MKEDSRRKPGIHITDGEPTPLNEDLLAPVPDEEVDEAEEKKDEQAAVEEDQQSGVQKVMEALSDDDDEHVSMSFEAFLRGDFFNAANLRRHVPFFLMVLVMIILYITNRYNSQQAMIRINELKKELTEIRYESMTRSSQLMMRTRESKIVEYFRNTSDSTLGIAPQPPFVIHPKQREK